MKGISSRRIFRPRPVPALAKAVLIALAAPLGAAAVESPYSLSVTEPDFSYTSGSELAERGLSVYIAPSLRGTPITSYRVRANIGAAPEAEYSSLDEYTYHWHLLSAMLHQPNWDAEASNVDIEVTGRATGILHGIVCWGEGRTLTLENVRLSVDVENAVEGRGLNVTDILVQAKNSVLNIRNLWLESKVDFRSAAEAAHNGVYAMNEGGVINLTGDVYINTNLTTTAEAYEGGYAVGVAKNDAVSGKYKGTVNINVAEDGSILDEGSTVRIFGNIDVKEGTVRAALSGADSIWYGAEVGAIKYDENTHEYGELREGSSLQLSLANGAQWVPDILEEDASAGLRRSYISAITLRQGGIINMHGVNLHTNASETVNEIDIYRLSTDGGIFRIDAEGSQGDAQHRNGTDFITVRSGSGTAYVQPLDNNRLEGASMSNPVRFADAAEGITFEALESTSSLVEGTLYDYTPVVAKNVTDERFGQYGNDWYFVGVEKTPGALVDVVRSASSVVYGDLIAHRALDTLNQRLGEIRDYRGGDTDDGMWVRWKRGAMEARSGERFDYDYDFYQLGYDRAVGPSANPWRVGAAFHVSDGDVEYRTGGGSLSTWGGTLYAAWAGDAGWYSDLVLSYAKYRNKFHLTEDGYTARATYRDDVVTASAEGGRKIELSRQVSIEPQLQLVYSRMLGSDYRISNGVRVDQDSFGSLIARAGFRLGVESTDAANPVRFYLKGNAYHEMLGERDYRIVGTDGQDFRGTVGGSDTWYTAGFGATAQWGRTLAFYGDFEKSFGGDINTDW